MLNFSVATNDDTVFRQCWHFAMAKSIITRTVGNKWVTTVAETMVSTGHTKCSNWKCYSNCSLCTQNTCKSEI